MFSQIIKSIFRSTLHKASIFDKQPILKVGRLHCRFSYSALFLLIHSGSIMRNPRIRPVRNKNSVRNSFHDFWSDYFMILSVVVTSRTIHSTSR